MKETITINTSPALTFAKLKMNGDQILVDTGVLKKQNVIVTVSGKHSRDGELYEEPIPIGAAGYGLDRILSFDRRILTAEGDIRVNNVFIGPGSCGMIVRIAGEPAQGSLKSQGAAGIIPRSGAPSICWRKMLPLTWSRSSSLTSTPSLSMTCAQSWTRTRG
jgi:hypothetical protein